MAVDTYALTTLENAKNYLGLSDSDLYTDAFTVYHDESASATAATVEVTDTTVVLIVTGGANAGTSTLTLSEAANDTVGELVAVINALGKGFVANVVANSSQDSGDLVVTPATSCFASSATQTLQITDNYLIEKLINRSSDIIETYCNRKFASRSYAGQLYDGNGSGILHLRNTPVTAVTRVSTAMGEAIAFQNTSSDAARALVHTTASSVVFAIIGGTNAGTETIAIASNVTLSTVASSCNAFTTSWAATVATGYNNWPSDDLILLPAQYCLNGYADMLVPYEPIGDYTIDDTIGSLYRGAGWPSGHNNISVDYTAGYSTIPDDIEHVCLEMTKNLYEFASMDSNKQSERMGDYNYVRDLQIGRAEDAFASLSKAAQVTLESYKRPILI